MKQFSLNKIKPLDSSSLSVLQILVERLMFYSIAMRVWFRDVEAVKFLMLPLPALFEVLWLRVRFCFQSLSSKCFPLNKNLTACTVSASSFRFHTPVCNSCDWLSTRFYKLHVTLLGLLGSATCWHVQQPKQTKKETTITTSWPLLATVKSRTLMSWQYWWYIRGLREKFFQGA